jgi:hypothetical protein
LLRSGCTSRTQRKWGRGGSRAQRLFPTCSEAMQCLETYHYFLISILQVPKAIIKSLLELENYTTNVWKNQTNYYGYVL